MTHDQISRIAYRLWQERGCPEGSPEEDWLRAEAEAQMDERDVEIESTTGLRRVTASEDEPPREVPTLRSEVPPSRGAKARSRRSDSTP